VRTAVSRRRFRKAGCCRLKRAVLCPSGSEEMAVRYECGRRPEQEGERRMPQDLTAAAFRAGDLPKLGEKEVASQPLEKAGTGPADRHVAIGAHRGDAPSSCICGSASPGRTGGAPKYRGILGAPASAYWKNRTRPGALPSDHIRGQDHPSVPGRIRGKTCSLARAISTAMSPWGGRRVRIMRISMAISGIRLPAAPMGVSPRGRLGAARAADADALAAKWPE